ncbi:protein translocase subunit SecF [Nocardioides marmorisolisilvae]|uniref:Protein-export membrane protein SecF n=1 Tax=Nocardioides marmorisolisilvae TaxID=1542737 RepID=A0A3N0DU99_9ACTN|nr:protein translocase subunit SecF [Nocardioides marmorisolisilvae]RNL79202.1 protein translocase subunit SecF [Nocardioides marmorisolisilvae]
MGKFSRLGNALYEGDTSINFVGRKYLWYAISGVILVLSVSGLFVKGLNLGIEFQGGAEFTVSLPQSQVTQTNADKVRDAVAGTGIKEASSPIVTTARKSGIRVQVEEVSPDQADQITNAIATKMNVDANSKISKTEVGASWGQQVRDRMIKGLVVFLILVVLFIWGYFREWKMSVAALVALMHDILITVGVYALSGFEVTPATVTGLLTILGFSLYDTVVVFDKVRENTKDLRSSRKTYAELANLAVNQTLVRSINTSIVALLPVGALLYVGIFSLGSGALKDLALALFVGMAVGAYSSIFIATPLVVQLKTAEKEISEQDRRAKARLKRDADRYADVPSFVEGMPVADPVAGEEPSAPVEERPTTPRPVSRPPASGSGRVVPEAKAPVRDSASAHRPQPTKQPRSKRGK